MAGLLFSIRASKRRSFDSVAIAAALVTSWNIYQSPLCNLIKVCYNRRIVRLSRQVGCGDTEQEISGLKKAEKTAASCKKFGWIPMSMQNRRTSIHGNGVTIKKGE